MEMAIQKRQSTNMVVSNEYRRVRRKVGANFNLYIFCYDGSYKSNYRINWHTIALNDEGGEYILIDRPPKLLVSFASTVGQGFLSTYVALEPFIYCLGGQSTFDSKWLKDVFRFDTTRSHNGWTKTNDMLAPRVEPKAQVVNGTIYVLGGTFFANFLEVPKVFYPITGIWKDPCDYAPLPSVLFCNSPSVLISNRAGAVLYE